MDLHFPLLKTSSQSRDEPSKAISKRSSPTRLWPHARARICESSSGTLNTIDIDQRMPLHIPRCTSSSRPKTLPKLYPHSFVHCLQMRLTYLDTILFLQNPKLPIFLCIDIVKSIQPCVVDHTRGLMGCSLHGSLYLQLNRIVLFVLEYFSRPFLLPLFRQWLPNSTATRAELATYQAFLSWL